MPIPAIRVESVSKQYEIGARQPVQPRLREIIAEAAKAPFRRLFSRNGRHLHPPTTETIWALKDVSFEVQPGEVVGIIGRNGAGKSTLLKILSRITEPTSGRVEINGRIGSLLEVGTGFHPDLTGRENVYLNGAILGMKRAEIARQFDEIVAFAEVEKFIDTPVKHYSSGMYMRLAFAVAAHLQPEILVVDEVLAVGDMAFRSKCYRRLAELRRSRTAIIVVSHNPHVVTSICDSVVYLREGHLAAKGGVGDVVPLYESAAFGSLQSLGRLDLPPKGSSQGLDIRSIFFRGPDGAVISRPETGKAASLCVNCRATRPLEQVSPSIIIRDSTGVDGVQLTLYAAQDNARIDLPSGDHEWRLVLSAVCLRPGHYTAKISLSQGDFWMLDTVEAFPFEIVGSTINSSTFYQPRHWQIVSNPCAS